MAHSNSGKKYFAVSLGVAVIAVVIATVLAVFGVSLGKILGLMLVLSLIAVSTALRGQKIYKDGYREKLNKRKQPHYW